MQNLPVLVMSDIDLRDAWLYLVHDENECSHLWNVVPSDSLEETKFLKYRTVCVKCGAKA